MKDARQIVVEALCRMERDASWSNLVLDAQMKKYPLSSRDSAFAGALFYGVLERQITLDACIAAHSTVRLKKLSPVVRATLRCGIYQLLYMEVPDNAAVHESVEIMRKLRQPKSAGFVNAVLRAFLRGKKQIPLPKNAPLSALLSVEYSCPAPLVELWLMGYGEEDTRRILADSLGRPPTTARVNTLRTTPATLAGELLAHDIHCREEEGLPACLTLEGTGAVHLLPQYRRGLFHLQDKSSQLCALALDPRPGERVLDACAAPGGKSFTMAQLMENKGELVAADLHPHRVGLIQKRAAEMGLSVIKARAADMTKPQPELGNFHRVLCDVPCSGLGVIRRKPEIKYKPLSEFQNLPNIQYKILENSAQYCKEGGALVYATCTLNPAENQEVAGRFLKNHPEFVPRPFPQGHALHGSLGDAWQKTLLGELGADGFFIANFTRLSS